MSISTAPVVLSTREAGILTLTLNRPEVLNGLTDDVLDAIAGGCREAATDDSVRVVVITGAGRGFCSGQDLRAGMDNPDVDIRGHLRDHYHPMIHAIPAREKPVVASVNGVAAGAGMSLALAADFRIAGESASFIQAFVRIGLVPDAGSSYFLPRLVADEDIARCTAEFAGRLARGPRSAGMIKKLFSLSHDSDLDTQLACEADAQAAAAQTSDFGEGVMAFMSKRATEFTGH